MIKNQRVNPLHQLSPRKNNGRAAQDRWAPQLQGRHLDSNVGNIGRIGCEAAADRVGTGSLSGLSSALTAATSASQARIWASANSPTIVRHVCFSATTLRRRVDRRGAARVLTVALST